MRTFRVELTKYDLKTLALARIRDWNGWQPSVKSEGMKAKLMMTSDLAKVVMVASLALPGSAIANGESKFGLQTPQTPVAHQLYDLHAITLGICIVVAVVVFGLMFYAIVRHRRSVGHEAKQFDTN